MVCEDNAPFYPPSPRGGYGVARPPSPRGGDGAAFAGWRQ